MEPVFGQMLATLMALWWPFVRVLAILTFMPVIGENMVPVTVRVLLVAAGTARLSNRKFKDRFAAKPRMLDAEQVLAVTSHPVGGVCPFGLPAPVPVYCDVSLKPFEEVVPAAGATNAAVRIAPERLAALVKGEWIDVCE